MITSLNSKQTRSLDTAELLDVFLCHAGPLSPFTLARLSLCSREFQGIVTLHIKVRCVLGPSQPPPQQPAPHTTLDGSRAYNRTVHMSTQHTVTYLQNDRLTAHPQVWTMPALSYFICVSDLQCSTPCNAL
jgi:hypothetical protein